LSAPSARRGAAWGPSRTFAATTTRCTPAARRCGAASASGCARGSPRRTAGRTAPRAGVRSESEGGVGSRGGPGRRRARAHTLLPTERSLWGGARHAAFGVLLVDLCCGIRCAATVTVTVWAYSRYDIYIWCVMCPLSCVCRYCYCYCCLCEGVRVERRAA